MLFIFACDLPQEVATALIWRLQMGLQMILWRRSTGRVSATNTEARLRRAGQKHHHARGLMLLFACTPAGHAQNRQQEATPSNRRLKSYFAIDIFSMLLAALYQLSLRPIVKRACGA